MSASPILDRTAPIYRRTMPPETQILPAIHALSARDFKVCENCGGPAMLHPKFEMAQIVAGEKRCCAAAACIKRPTGASEWSVLAISSGAAAPVDSCVPGDG